MDPFEKKYKEALERSKQVKDIELAEYIFPELKEIEDERMSNIILEGFKNYSRSFSEWNDVPVERIIAYLERQKEPENVSASTMAPSCWQKEQKPAEPSGKLSRQDYLYQLLIDQLITYSDYEYLIGQKPAEWSEEDEKMLSDVLESLRRYQLSMPNFQVELQMRWLKSLHPQPKRVWRRFLWHPTMQFDYTSIVKYDGSDEYEIVKAGNKPTREMNGVFIPIKEISTQPHWKPSEEQLRALNHFLDFHRPQYTASTHGWTAYEGLKSLYDQLLKLK